MSRNKQKKNKETATPDKVKAASSDTKAASTLEWVKSIAIAIGIALLIRWPVAEPFKIPSGSMEPTLHGDARMLKGDRIFVNKHEYGIRYPFNGFRIPFTSKVRWYSDNMLIDGPMPERWDIVVFKAIDPNAEHDTLVKRVVALPGEQVLIRGGKLIIDGEPMVLPDYMPDVRYTDAPFSNGYGLIPDEEHSIVPKDHVFLLGDNSASSKDARWFGWVHKRHILGEVTSIWWPLGRWRDFTGFTTSVWWIGLWSLVGLYTFARLFLGRSVRTYGSGLAGLLQHGEHAVIRFAQGWPVPFTRLKLGQGRDPGRGEVVLYRPPKDAKGMPPLLLGIVAGLPGERVYLDQGKLEVDGKPVESPTKLSETSFSPNGQTGKYGTTRSKEYSQIPEAHYYVLTDSADGLPDSRSLGWLAREHVVGTAAWVWWPLRRSRALRGISSRSATGD